MRRCSKCGVDKPLADFGKNRSRPDGLAHWCKACARAGNAKYYRTNTETARAATKRWNAENADRKAEKQRQWHAANPGFYADYKRQRRQDGRHNFAADSAKTARRRAQQARATPTWANPGKVRAFYESADALNMLTGEWYHVDHVVPLRSPLVCGLHNEFNLQILAAAENQAKSNRHWPGMP